MNLKLKPDLKLILTGIFAIVVTVAFYNLFHPRDYTGFITYSVVFVLLPSGLFYWLLDELKIFKTQHSSQPIHAHSPVHSVHSPVHSQDNKEKHHENVRQESSRPVQDKKKETANQEIEDRE